ncbi:hypothetical protein [Cohnella sp. GCM10012308]
MKRVKSMAKVSLTSDMLFFVFLAEIEKPESARLSGRLCGMND